MTYPVRNGVTQPSYPENCQAAEVLKDRGVTLQSDFDMATKHIVGYARTLGRTIDSPQEASGKHLEAEYELESGMGRLAWQCAGCRLQDDSCSAPGSSIETIRTRPGH